MAKPTKKKRKSNSPAVCNKVLSEGMKAGDPKQAMTEYWDCRREHAPKKPKRTK